MMSVTPEWLPLEHLLERTLLGELVRQRRRFIRALHYEAGPSAALASALLLDMGDVPLPLHVEAGSAVQRAARTKERRSAPGSRPWIGRPAEALAMPALPPPDAARFAPGPRGAVTPPPA
jgi:hypothetical protein